MYKLNILEIIRMDLDIDNTDNWISAYPNPVIWRI